MSRPHDIPVRNARNRVIDLLGLGDTYPLTDLPVAAAPPKVTFRDTTQVLIESAQAGVSYQLLDPAGAALGRAEGSDALLEIKTPPVLENVTFRVRATKKPRRDDLPAQAPLTLDAAAPVKVGLDSSLVIRFKDNPPLPLLDPSLVDPPPAAPRLVRFGTALEVEIEASQEGVSYTLIIDGRELRDTVRIGNRRTISLPTGALREDAVIQVRATKTLFTDNQPVVETEPLLARLFVKVMADPALAVAVAAPQIVDFGQGTALRIANAQPSVLYRAWGARIADASIVRGDDVRPTDIVVPVPGQPDVHVQRPATGPDGPLPTNYRPLGDALQAGTGGELLLPLPGLTEDTVLLVQATKVHHNDAGAAPQAAPPTIESTLRLSQAGVVLVRPDPAPALVLRVDMAGTQTGRRLQVRRGTPGVYYHFQPLPAGEALPLPAYFHQTDLGDPTQNKGFEQLAIGIDFSIATDAPQAPGPAGDDRARLAPSPPELDMTPLAAGSQLAVVATKAQTALSTALAAQALIAAVPDVAAAAAVVDRGATATVLVPASDPADLYQLTLLGQAVQAAVAGNGGELAFTTDALLADTGFELVATRVADAGLRVERAVPVQVRVRPDAGLQVLARRASVPQGGGTDIVVQASQRGVDYQLMSGAAAVGGPVAGTGGDIALPTGPLAADARFTVTAQRADQPQITTALLAQAVVTVTAP
jgi:hypothetical protein